MSEQQPSSGLTNPQILVAIIGALTTVVVAAIGVLPNIIASTKPPTPTVTPIVVTATSIPASDTPIPIVIPPTATESLATVTESPPTTIPTEITVVSSNMVTLEPSPTSLPVIQLPTTIVPPIQAEGMQPPNVRLIYDGVSFSLLNLSGQVISLEGVRFHGGDKEWDARNWGPSIYTSLPAGKCLRLRDSTAGQRQPPAPCRNKIYGLIEVGSTAFFWRDAVSFDVVRNGNTISTCTAEDGNGECDVYIGD